MSMTRFVLVYWDGLGGTTIGFFIYWNNYFYDSKGKTELYLYVNDYQQAMAHAAHWYPVGRAREVCFVNSSSCTQTPYFLQMVSSSLSLSTANSMLLA